MAHFGFITNGTVIPRVETGAHKHQKKKVKQGNSITVKNR